MKYKNYVKICYINGEEKYVTRINGSCFFTKDGTEALALGITAAKNLLYGLACNFYHAHIEVHPDFHVVCNPAKENFGK